MRAMLTTVAALLVWSCASGPTIPDSLATAHVVADFDSYALRRVGLMPFVGRGAELDATTALEEAFYVEFSQSTPYEVVMLERADLEETARSEPYRRGWYDPRTIIQLARRYKLDALFVGTVTQLRSYPPQQLSIGMELVSAETGTVLWTSRVHLDAADRRVRDSLEAYVLSNRGSDSPQLSLLSPSNFARFAAWQVARML